MRREARPLIGILLLSCLLSLTAHTWAAPQREAPPFAVVERIVHQHFTTDPHYAIGDPISRSQVVSLLNRLRVAGWHVRKKHGIPHLALPDAHYLMRQLRSDRAAIITPQLRKCPLAYDRLHRLSLRTEGRQLLQSLLAGHDDRNALTLLTADAANEEIRALFEAAPEGVDFDEPTGRIYCVLQLLERLKVAYDEDVAIRATSSIQDIP